MVNIYYKLEGAHYHMRVFLNGGKMGDLVCRQNEFGAVQLAFYKARFIGDGFDPAKDR